MNILKEITKMTDNILDNVVFIIVIIITGAILITLGNAFQSILLTILGGIFIGALPIIKLVQAILKIKRM